MENKLQDLKRRLREIDDLESAVALLEWDQATYMPPGGGRARGRQMATLGRLAHEKLTDPAVGALIDALGDWAANRPYHSDDASLVRAARKKYDRAARIPTELMAAFQEHAAAAYQAWTHARPADDFRSMAPFLEKTVDFSRRIADCFPGYAHIADPLIDMADEGMTAAAVRSLFAELRVALVPMVEAAARRPPADDDCLRGHFPPETQLAFGRRVIEDLGFDFHRGRQDMTRHPFMTKFSLGDVRITTRIREDHLGEALFSTLHEAGHAMYEMGIDPALDGTPLARGASSGVHESQSRLWENLVGRSRPFWSHYFPKLQEALAPRLDHVDPDTFYRAVNRVERSLIRTDADELTYNLHVMIRFDLELALLEGSLKVRELPDAWHSRYEADLGLRAPGDRDGVLQDVHWYGGLVGGAFQGYTLGNILSALFFEKAVEAHPGIPARMAEGRFEDLHSWLREHIYRHGGKFTAEELVLRVTDGPLTTGPYLRYLAGKFEGMEGRG